MLGHMRESPQTPQCCPCHHQQWPCCGTMLRNHQCELLTPLTPTPSRITGINPFLKAVGQTPKLLEWVFFFLFLTFLPFFFRKGKVCRRWKVIRFWTWDKK